jgi:hypothetical protein
MAAKTDKPNGVEHKMGDVIERGALDDGRPFHDIFLGEGKTYRVTRIWVKDADAAWDASQLPDDKGFNPRLNSRLRLASSIVDPATTIDDFDRLTEVELSALFRGFGRLNELPRADDSGNA